jgi:3-dehydroquinate synthase
VSGGDPFETGAARPLDFGHWAAHKLEQLSGYKIRHGEAVASGMALDVIYSRQTGLLGGAAAERALSLLEGLGFELFCGEMLLLDEDHQPALLRGLEEFREHLGGELSLTMLQDIGRSVQIHEISLTGMGEAIYVLQERRSRAGGSTLHPEMPGGRRG